MTSHLRVYWFKNCDQHHTGSILDPPLPRTFHAHPASSIHIPRLQYHATRHTSLGRGFCMDARRPGCTTSRITRALSDRLQMTKDLRAGSVISFVIQIGKNSPGVHDFACMSTTVPSGRIRRMCRPYYRWSAKHSTLAATPLHVWLVAYCL